MPSPVTPAASSSLAPPVPASTTWTVEALLTPVSRWVGLAVFAVSFVFPLGGLGVDLCWLHATTGLPCPGCGLSRGVSAISQGQLDVAWGLNPFAFVVWPTFAFLAVLAVLPKAARARVEAWLRSSPRAGKAYELIFWSFLGFGLLRFVVFLALHERFP